MQPSLLDQIERDALDSNVKVADALRKCVALGGQAKSTELRMWASRELRGYSGSDDLPDYRVVPAAIALDGVTVSAVIKGQRIPPSSLPDFVQEKVSETVELRHPIGEIEELARRHSDKNESVKLSLPMGADIARYMNSESSDPYQQISSLYWMMSPISLFAIVDQVRTTLVELMAELRAGMPKDQTIPSPETAANAVHVAVHGRRHNVTVTASQGTASLASTSATPQAASSWWTPWRRVGATLVGLATIAGAVIALLQWLER
jgi:hypothetical protein